MLRRYALAFLLVASACKKDSSNDHKTATGSGSGLQQKLFKVEQVAPPFDLKTPPADAVKTATGLIYKKLVTNDAGTAPKRNDTVMINYTGWKQNTGETFFTNGSKGVPMPLNLANTAPGFTEGMQLLKTGEKAVLWLPASIGYRDNKPGGETLVYQVEVVEIKPAPAIPEDVAAPPANAQTSKGGSKFVVLRPGTGTAKAHSWDEVTYNYTAWDATGRMYETTEMKKHPSKVTPYKQSAALEEAITSMTAGERIRVWTTGEKMAPNGKPAPNQPTGPVCYEIEVITIEPGVEPPPVPADVAKPPGDAQKTAKGNFYKVIKSGGKSDHPKTTESVRVNYTGWTTDGRMFDTSTKTKQPAEFRLQGVIAGWTDVIPLMSTGDKYRVWIPEENAYKNQPGRPQGMLVFEIELVEIKPAPAAPVGDKPPGGMPGGMPPHGHPPMGGAPGAH
ncbi:MAG: FKBP-type peptidyl-prolyl cis-trans isomerase [Kofleriaceae bacterium]